MTVDQLLDAIGLLPPDLLAETERARAQKSRKVIHFRRYIALAASVALFLWGAWFLSLTGQGSSKEAAAGTSSPALADNAPADWDMGVVTGSSLRESSRSTTPGSFQVPILELQCGTQSLQIPSDNYTWSWSLEDGTGQGVTATGPYPPDMGEDLPVLAPEDAAVQLVWDLETPPTALTLRRWAAGSREPIQEALSAPTFQLTSGEWVYEITACWDHNTASYCFRADCPEPFLG